MFMLEALRSIQSVPGVLSILRLQFSLSHICLHIFGENFFFLNVCYLTQTIIRQLSWFAPRVSFLMLTDLLSIETFKFVLFFFDKGHEFPDIPYWIKVNVIIFLATWTIHKMMLLTGKILDDSFNIRRQTSLWAIKFKMLYLPCKFTELLRSELEILPRFLSLSLFLEFRFLLLFFHLYKLLLMTS